MNNHMKLKVACLLSKPVALGLCIILLVACMPQMPEEPVVSDTIEINSYPLIVETSGTPAGVVGGVVEPDYNYPWVVSTTGTLGCHGTLIHPRWVLTAAHCVESAAHRVSFTRTDPYTGTLNEDERGVHGGWAHIHPMYNSFDFHDDIALIELDRSFSINPYIQTVGLPTDPRVPGVVGIVASTINHNMQLPPGKVAIFRASIPQDNSKKVFEILTSDASGSICPGDSGSGFITYENGRATVRGIAVNVNASADCVTPSGNRAGFTDVFYYKDWILHTMGMTDFYLVGNTRLHSAGPIVRGLIGIACSNPHDGQRYETLWGPLDVYGVEEGQQCEKDAKQVIICALFEDHAAGSAPTSMQVRITGFTMKTMSQDGSTKVESLPFSDKLAVYDGEFPFGDFREFTCHIGPNTYDPGDGGVLTP